MEMPVIGLCIAAVTFMVLFALGVLMLLGKFDGLILKSAQKKGESVDVKRNRRILGYSFLADSIIVPLMIAFLFGLI